MGRHFPKLQRTGRGHDLLFVNLNALEPCHIGTRGYDDVFCCDDLACHIDNACRLYLSGSPENRDLVLLQQEVDALGVAVNGFLLERHHLAQVKGW